MSGLRREMGWRWALAQRRQEWDLHSVKTCVLEARPLSCAKEVRTMAGAAITQSSLKRALREALTETLQEQREFLHEVFAEALEEFALAEAIREGKKTKRATREEVFRVLRGKG